MVSAPMKKNGRFPPFSQKTIEKFAVFQRNKTKGFEPALIYLTRHFEFCAKQTVIEVLAWVQGCIPCEKRRGSSGEIQLQTSWSVHT
jgi:hypothetical protein